MHHSTVRIIDTYSNIKFFNLSIETNTYVGRIANFEMVAISGKSFHDWFMIQYYYLYCFGNSKVDITNMI